MNRMKSMSKGFVTGVALSLVVAAGVLVTVRSTNAQGSNDIWTDGSQNVTATASTVSSTTTTPTISPAPIATAPPVAALPIHTSAYVGLGDSVPAGLGLPTWTTATSQDKSCGRSPYSYVFEVGRQLNRPHAPYACSGATSASLTSGSNSQLNQTFAQGVPAVISITVGANDIAWSSLIRSCYNSTCGTVSQTNSVNAGLVNVQSNLIKALQQIQDRSGDTPPLVVLTGYYNPVSQQCTITLPDRITTDEVNWMSAGVDALNQTIKGVATTYGSFARFAPVDFSGHDICSATPWIQGLSDPAPIHPNAAGQQAIARSVVQAARN